MHILSEHSPEINELTAALAKVQATLGAAKKEAHGQVGKATYQYAGLSAVWGALQPELGQAELAVFQMVEQVDTADGRSDYIATTLAHSSGQWIRSRTPVFASPGGGPINAAQAYGSAMTYARRYGLSALLGVVTEDDDGAAAGRPENAPLPSEAVDDPVCIAFKSKPNQRQKSQLLEAGFTWNGDKFRWEALPTDTATTLVTRILGEHEELVKYTSGTEVDEPADTENTDDENELNF